METTDKSIPAGAASLPEAGIANRLRAWLRNYSWDLAIVLVFLAIVFFFYPDRVAFEFSTDEGINLMKAALVNDGYPLYDQIWSDQPPLFTYIIAAVLKVFMFKVGTARGVVLAFSILLLLSAFHFVELAWGRKQALAAVALIFFSPLYLVLSNSVMVGLPAIAFAMLALFLLAKWHRDRRWAWLILSAVVLSLSMLTKLFTGFLAPIFVVGLLVSEYRQRSDRRWLPVLAPSLVWGTIFSVLTLGLALVLVGPGNLAQLVEPHLSATRVVIFQNDFLFDINWQLKQAWPFVALAVVGVLVTVQARHWLMLYPLAWAVTAYLLLTQHTPVWDHQQLLVTVPAAMLGGVAAYQGIAILAQIAGATFDTSRSGLLKAATVIALFTLLFTFRTPDPFKHLSPTPSIPIGEGDLGLGNVKDKFLTKVIKYAPETNWVVTDLPMYAFRARLLVPPELAVFSSKRLETGNLTEAQIIDAIRQYKPEQVLLGRFQYPQVERYLAQGYRLIYFKGDQIKLYIRQDIGR